MAEQSLAVKYRPKTFEDITEQTAIKQILQNQIDTNTVKHGYLFCGPAGCGKTTAGRIFANEINHGQGTPIELDAASNNSVEDIRRLTEQAQTQSLDSEYKTFIIDECHSLSSAAWQAFLKTLEEPPAKSIFILCTTDPQKIPATILSRVQRYNFQKISQEGIMKRLQYIVIQEGIDCPSSDALEYLSKLAEGGMRDGITLLDKVSSYAGTVTVDNVVKALGVADYDIMLSLTHHVLQDEIKGVIEDINTIYSSGADMKQFIKSYFEFILDANIYHMTKVKAFVKVPNMIITTFMGYNNTDWEFLSALLDMLIELQNDIKYEQNPKPVIVAHFMLFMRDIYDRAE